MALNTALRRARCAASLTQMDLAERSGVPQTSISAIERGRCPESVILAIRLARSLGLTVEELFGAMPDRPMKRRRRVYKGPTATTVAEAAERAQGAAA